MSSRRIGNRRVAGLLGLAFDADDGHTRITRGKHFILAGGSEDSHDQMRETVVKVTEELDRRGQQLTDISVRQLCDLIQEAQS